MPKHASLYFAVFSSGSSVLALEILGTRILGPTYGVSIFLWSALITVTLAALSVGYWLGGRNADRGADLGTLAKLLLGAGLWTLFIPWLKAPLLEMAGGLSLRMGVLMASTLLFAPPLLLLGMVSPLAVRLRTRDLKDVGRAAGDLYALGTLASVFGALAVGFWLIPVLGVNGLLLAIAGLLFLAAAGAWASRGSRGLAAALLVFLVGSAVASSALGWSTPDGFQKGTLILEQSAYGEIEVRQMDDIRYLLIDGGVHTAELLDGLSTHEYAVASDVFKLAFEEPGKMLLLGLGGGSVAHSWAEAGWDITTVEIDPVVARLAEEYFAFTADDSEVVMSDARRFLRETQESYDFIFVDVFGSSSIPFHLVSHEFFGELSEHLAPDGILLMNIEAVGWHDGLIASIAASAQTHLPQLQAFPVAEPPSSLGNVLLGASRRSMPWLNTDALPHPQDVINDGWNHFSVIQQHHAWDSRFDPVREGALVLSDDLNPVDLWSEQINRVAREQLNKHFDGPKLGGRGGIGG